jgi:undecaprenyl pyrophosphate phosphatase UppP
VNAQDANDAREEKNIGKKLKQYSSEYSIHIWIYLAALLAIFIYFSQQLFEKC